MKIALLHGAKNNAGDFLIKNRTELLIKSMYPECQIKEFFRNELIDIDVANKCDITVLAGGPLLMNEAYPIFEQAMAIDNPLLIFGIGCFLPSYANAYNYCIDNKIIDVLKKSISEFKYIGCRDFVSANILRNNGIDATVMTGCPAWYDLDYLCNKNYFIKRLAQAKTICISDCGSEMYTNDLIELMKYVSRFFGQCKIYLVCHKNKDNNELISSAKELNIEYINILNSEDGFEVYDKCDLHIGFRVHAHIYCMSHRKLSILLSEDYRGIGVNNALGLNNINVYENANFIYELDDYIMNLDSTNYVEINSAFYRMKQYFDLMKNHLHMIRYVI